MADGENRPRAEWEGWGEIRPAPRPPRSRVRLSAHASGFGAQMRLFLSGEIGAAFTRGDKARLLCELAADAGERPTARRPRFRVQRGGDRTLGATGRHGVITLISPKPAWLPLRAGAISCEVLARDADGVTFALDLDAWEAMPERREKPPKPAAKQPPAAASLRPSTPQPVAAAPVPATCPPPLHGPTVTWRALETMLRRAGHEAERIAQDLWEVDGEQVTPNRAVQLVNIWQAKRGEQPVRLARA